MKKNSPDKKKKKRSALENKKPLLKVVVNRKKHLRGNGGTSVLRNESGAMCCLGFVSRALGIPAADMIRKNTPHDLARECPDAGEMLEQIGLVKEKITSCCNTYVCEKMMDVNDDPELNPSDREQRLTAMAREIGIDMSFKG